MNQWGQTPGQVTSHVKVPFEIDSEGLRVEENEIHRSIRELLANALIHADYHGRRGIVIEKQAQTISFSNPGIFRVNKAVAVEGGTSDARNSHIFNIFALVDIGERSGMGLADLYGHWKKHGLPEPVISEEYDPDRVKITVYTDSDQGPANRPKSAQESAQGAPKVPQGDPRPDQDPTKTRPRPDQDPAKIRPIAWSDLPSSCRQVYEALRQDAFLTYRGMVSKLGLNKDTINTAIGTLVRKGFIRREGNKQTGHWEVVK